MSQRIDSISRSQLIGGVIATGALAACGGGVNTTVVSSGSGTIAPNCGTVSANAVGNRFGVNDIFSDQAFSGVDKQALLGTFDPTPNIDALHQGYIVQAGQQLVSANVITQIPSKGIVIQSPGTYTFGGNILWSPNAVTCSAITIQSSNVTLNLAGFTLTASVSDKSQQISGILVSGPATNITITNGTVAGAFAVTYTDCKADHCDVGFDTWYHVDSTWIRPIYTNCTTGILVEPGGTRTVSGDPCSECSPPITVTLTNFESGNIYPH